MVSHHLVNKISASHKISGSKVVREVNIFMKLKQIVLNTFRFLRHSIYKMKGILGFSLSHLLGLKAERSFGFCSYKYNHSSDMYFKLS